MQSNSNGNGQSTYLISVRREQTAELAVDADGPDEAMAIASERIGAGELLVWATVEGIDLAATVAQVDEPAEAVA